jgi:hypothetical protein
MDERTNLADIIGLFQPRLYEEETEEEYVERLVFEFQGEIKEAILYDISMGNVDWKKAGCDLDEFCQGWVRIYAENVIEGIGFQNLPILED